VHARYDFIFTGPKGGMLRRTFAARVFVPAVRRTGLDETLTFHGLRHLAARLMVEAGEHPRVIQQRLGHATSRLSMELYAHVPEAADRNVATHLDPQFAIPTGTQRARGTCVGRPLSGGTNLQVRGSGGDQT
jgi:integrase